MTEVPSCSQHDALVSYLYGEGDEAGREQFEAHLATCGSCAADLDAFHRVRQDLICWSPPEGRASIRVVADPGRAAPWWKAPAWGLAAAAVLVVAIAAAIAQVEVRYGTDGVVIRTGWVRSTSSLQSRAAVGPVSPLASVTRTDLGALEQRLRREFSTGAVRPVLDVSKAPSGSMNQADLLRRVRALLEESEQRQQRELALRVAELARDFDVQRQTDLVQMQQNLGRLEGMTGAEAARQRELLNYLVRVSQRPRQ